MPLSSLSIAYSGFRFKPAGAFKSNFVSPASSWDNIWMDSNLKPLSFSRGHPTTVLTQSPIPMNRNYFGLLNDKRFLLAIKQSLFKPLSAWSSVNKTTFSFTLLFYSKAGLFYNDSFPIKKNWDLNPPTLQGFEPMTSQVMRQHNATATAHWGALWDF